MIFLKSLLGFYQKNGLPEKRTDSLDPPPSEIFLLTKSNPRQRGKMKSHLILLFQFPIIPGLLLFINHTLFEIEAV